MKVCVIGAGPSGLTTIKQLCDEGHDVVCFEQEAEIGGIWYRHDGDADQMKVYDDLVLTVSLKLMCYSDFMVDERRFTDHNGYFAYLKEYAAKYGLRDHIRFNTAVDRVKKVGNEWRVMVTSKGQTSEHAFGAVAICSGPFRSPLMDVAHLDKFKGEVVHSSRYRNNEKYRGKRVLVIGLAESGADILREISDVSSHCTLAIRSRSFLLPRLFSGKYSTDMTTCRVHHHEMYARATDVPFPPSMKSITEDENVSRSAFYEATRVYGMMMLASHAVAAGEKRNVDEGPDAVNNLGQPMWPLKLDLFTEWNKENSDLINEWNRKSHNNAGTYSPKIIFSKNVSFIPNIANGKIRVNDTPIKDVQGKTAHFEDRTVQEYDIVMLCTGFKNDFSLLGDVKIPDNNVRNLYKHCVHPDHGGRFAMMGFIRPYSGGIPICAEMQARYFALLCSDKLKLPADVHQRIQEEKAWEETWSEFSPRHSEAHPSQVIFLDSIAREIGCLPAASELVKQPALLAKLWFCAFNQAGYRLTGPHSMYEMAYKQIMNEEFPGRSPAYIAELLARSALPSNEHPMYMDMLEFPFAADEGLVRSTLEAMALSGFSAKHPSKS